MSNVKDTSVEGSMKVADLRRELQTRGLDKRGVKDVLVKRLQEHNEYLKKYEKDVTRCICSFMHDDGHMISCDKCL